ncbi:protein of unknown function [Zhouia amylolytica]|uniref:Type 9 secretion system plug protein N-terminal domain-containing protein n=1 Tax=Zhouia amylolytica TaxID=376730 RepID=A0A1I6RQF5_9FLAO|nr:DUF5103 domain-containing protein [Zhouia amylolytica]SFS66866.1 protein of unknown function [Zhouia amylolytica]
MKHLLIILLFTLHNPLLTQAQKQKEVAPPDYIKTIIFKGSNEADQFPIVRLNDLITLTFDDLYADEADYYYKIEHCDFDWKPSDIVKSQYLKGLDNQRITNYRNSVATLKPYTHYELKIPNQQTRVTRSGNYILKIFNSYDELMFSRRFIVYQNAVSVGVTIKTSRDLNLINSKQVVQYTVNTNNLNIVNPQQELKTVILKNYHWDTAIKNIKPQFISGNQYTYKYDKETAFNGGNEYLYFENKDIRVPANKIRHVELNDIYEHHLYTDEDRSNQLYTYNPDINGDFRISSLESENSYQADYANVHFSIPYENKLGFNQVYIYGKFNNYELSEENKLAYNEEHNLMEGSILLKQGFYNYKYILVDEEGKKDLHYFSGNHSETENEYLVIVYYRNFGQNYDSVIGIGSANSTNITKQ